MRTGFERLDEQLPALDVDPLNDAFQRGLGVDQVAILLGEAAEAGFQVVEFVEGVEVHRAELGELVAELGDFALHIVAARVSPLAEASSPAAARSMP